MSGVATKRTKCRSGGCEHQAHLRQVAMFIAAAGTLGQRRAVGGRFADERAQFTTRVNPSTASVFVRNRGAVSDIALVSITVPVIIAAGFGSRSPSRRSGGFWNVVALAGVLVWRGLIRRAV